MYQQIFFILLSLCLISCGTVTVHEQLTNNVVEVDRELLGKGDYIDIVFEDGKYSYLSYLKEENIDNTAEKSFTCPDGKTEYITKNGIIIWDYKKIKGKEKEVLKKLKSLNFKMIYVQISDNLIGWLDLLKIAHEMDIVVFALDGSPEYINDPKALLENVKGLIEFNQKYSYRIDGILIDIEPYILKDFNINKKDILKKYVTLLKNIKEITDKKIILNTVIPFWYDKLFCEDEPLLNHIFNLSDEITVMSYRTELEEIRRISEEELCLGLLLKKPVYLAIEINKLPSEKHLIFKKNTVFANLIKKDNKYYLPFDKIVNLLDSSFEVKGDTLSFYRKKDKIFDILKSSVPKKAFAGWIVHSYEGMYE